MGNHLKALGLLYARPFEAISLILDRGRLGWALTLALATSILLAVPAYLQALETASEDLDRPELVPLPSTISLSSILLPLGLLAVVFVPIAVIVVNKLEGTGSAGVVLPRDYMPMLVCHLMAASAALLPLAIIAWIAPGILHATVSILALVFFAFLSVCIIRTLSGAGFSRSIVTMAVSFAGSAGAVYLYTFVSGALYFLASPFVLYYLYIMFGQGIGSELRGVGGGLSSRQRMRELLETATVNPRDADARYQLGLIYQQRRDYNQARKAFEEAISIDPKEAEAHYQLGRVLRAQGDLAGALAHLTMAASIDRKAAQSEVLRETGATLLGLDRNAEARDILHEFTVQRGFDPEGWYWLGIASARLGDTAAAAQAFDQAIESVRTAPPHLRRQASKWQSLASKQRRRLS